MYKPSKLTFAELLYNKAAPNNIKQEAKPPNKKYVKPADVANSEFLYKLQAKYKP